MSAYEGIGVVSWSDTDASGRIHYTAAMKWVENVEHQFYREQAPGLPLSQMPRRVVTATYNLPFACGEQYYVRLMAKSVGRTSIQYVWQVLKGDLEAIVGSHTVVHVGTDGQAMPMPGSLRHALESITVAKPNAGSSLS